MFSGEDVYRPSYFEMIASDRLVSSLKPSLGHICQVLARRHRAFRFLPAISEELFAAISFALEKHYLENYDGSFSENFYGLKRICVTAPTSESAFINTAQTSSAQSLSTALFGADAVQAAASSAKAAAAAAASQSSSSSSSSSISSSSASTAASSSATTAAFGGSTAHFRPLSFTDRRRALFFLVLVPYLKARLDALFLRVRDRIDGEGFEIMYDPAQHSPAYNTLRSAFLKLYPIFHAMYEGTHLLFGLRFLFERSVYYSPEGFLLKQVCRRMNMDEMNAPPLTSLLPPAAVVPYTGITGLIRRIVSGSGGWLSNNAKYLVLIAIFSFKFLEWWYSPANAYYNASGGGVGGKKLPIPPPPAVPAPVAGGIAVPANSKLCPLCMEERSNPAVTTSGYVFCYACIHQYLTQQQPRCPITLRPCAVEQLRKIYEN